jgi:hypothetical protein
MMRRHLCRSNTHPLQAHLHIKTERMEHPKIDLLVDIQTSALTAAEQKISEIIDFGFSAIQSRQKTLNTRIYA